MRESVDTRPSFLSFGRRGLGTRLNRYLNSRLIIFYASELATELFDEAQGPRCKFAISIATAKLPAWSHHVHVIMQYKMASNIQLKTGRDREIAGLILMFR